LSLDAAVLSTGFGGAARRFVAACTIAASTTAFAGERILYAETPSPLAASISRAAFAAARTTSAAADEPAARPHASRAEKAAWAYLLVGGCIFIATSPGEKNADGTWSRDGKAEMAAGIGAVGISFALLWDIIGR